MLSRLLHSWNYQLDFFLSVDASSTLGVVQFASILFISGTGLWLMQVTGLCLTIHKPVYFVSFFVVRKGKC